MGGVLQFISVFSQYLPVVAQIGGDVVEAMEWGTAKVKSFQGNEPTEEDWRDLNARIAANTAALNQDPPAA